MNLSNPAQWLRRFAAWATEHAERLLYEWISAHSDQYVVVDGEDNSVTISPALLRRIRHDNYGELENATSFSYILCAGRDTFGFSINAPVAAACAGVSRLQHNAKYRCIGFESLCPTVNRILYDYGISERRAKLYVRRRCLRMQGGRRLIVYQYLRPWN